MPLSLVRVDDRLIHGQVIAVWTRQLSPTVIVVADDDTANDDFLAEIIELAAPPGVDVEVHDLLSAAPRMVELAASPAKAFVLVKSPVAALRLRELGAPIEVLNIGGIGAAPDRRPLYKNISASEPEIAAMAQLERIGTRVQFQIVSDDTPVPFASVAPSTKEL